ncbi:MAG: DUF4132 domain-containing protein, partial [Lachnospiraceae bacterium]|nr:DUF4132 domain-containing protein [Lachnospiraceae bacterium]
PSSAAQFSPAQNANGAEQEKDASPEQGEICGAAAPAADEEYLQAILLCYASAAVPSGDSQRAAVPVQRGRISKNAMFLASALNAEEFSVYVNELFDKWLAAGAESKKRWVLYAAALHGGAAIVGKLKQQIQEWPQCARGAIACEAVYALSLNPLPQALLAVDGIARNFRFRQVKAAAGKALDFAAGSLNISREELADRVVPDFGFDENMERYVDYGTRAFLAVLTPELELEVFETAQVPEKDAGKAATRAKRLKTLPSPGRKDDAAKAAAAYKEFKQLKKQLKTTVTSQKQRLEYALWSAREWRVDAWKQLFLKNPVMHPFATRLIWGVYEDGRLVQSFRYMGDGSFGTADEEEYLPPAGGRIALVHPMELADEAKNAWKQQLSDYEIRQPVEQLSRTVFRVTPEETGQKELARFRDRIINDIALGRSLTKLGWNRGMVEDAGCFDTWYREDAELGLGVELDFSGSYVEGEDEDVTIYGARFYRVRRDGQGSLRYGAENEECVYALQDVPARYFSEVVWQLEKALR